MPADDDPALLAYIADLYQMEATRAYNMDVGPYSLFVLICAIQLALRHPEFTATAVGAQVRQLLGQLRTPFAGTLGEVLLAKGDDPAHGVSREGKWPAAPPPPPPDLNPYEAAAARYEAALRHAEQLRQESKRLLAAAEDEYDAARANLARYESRPGIPLPEYRI